jgi:hypothetical protein
VSRAIDLRGQRFGRWSVIRRGPNSVEGKPQWICACDCGSRPKAIRANALLWERSTNCGCVRREKLIAVTRSFCLSHGESQHSNFTAEYRAWCAMKTRCTNRKTRLYHRYGGRGIRVCQEWVDSYEAFLAHVGRRPSAKHSLDRIDNDGHYEPGNVRWATKKQQGRNRAPPRLHLATEAVMAAMGMSA